MSQYRTQEQWLELITECRQSGMTDMDWCRANGISRSSFYKALSRLRKAACSVPASSKSLSGEVNLTSSNKQDIVPVSIVPDDPLSDLGYGRPAPLSCVMEIIAGSIKIKVSNDVSASVLTHTLSILGDIS